MTIWDIINDLSFNKVGNFDAALYNPYIVNKSFSMHPDTVFLANIMNMSHELPKEMQYDFYFHSVDKKRRFSSWAKKTKNDDAEVVSEYYKCNMTVAKTYLKLLSKENIKEIKTYLSKGGMNKKKKG